MAFKTTIGNVPLRNTTKPIKDAATEKALRKAQETNQLATIPKKSHQKITAPRRLDVRA